MKKHLFLILAILACKSNYAQTYYPFPETGIWTYEELDDFWNPTGMLSVHYINGDTIFLGKSYKKLYVNQVFKGGIRDSGKIVTFFNVDSMAAFTLYDFNLVTGDTIFNPYDEAGGSLSGFEIVEMTDSVLLADGNYHKRWYLSTSSTEIIEGVGSTRNLLSPAYPGSVSGGWRLNCFLNSSTLIYSSSGTCINAIEETDLNFTSIKIYPNPTTEFISIEKNTFVEQKSGYRIMDASGKVVLEENSIPEKIDIRSLKPGNYTIVFENDGKSQPRKFIRN